MRIAFVTASLTTAGAGVKAVVELLSQALADAGHEVRVFGVSDRAWRGGEHANWKGAEPVALRSHSPILYAPAMLSKLLDWEPDVVHSHGLWLHHSRTVLQWHKCTGRPYVVSPHGMLAPKALCYSPLKKKVAAMMFETRALRSAACLHATCEREVEEFRAYGLTGPAFVVPNAVQVPAAGDLETTKRNVVFSLGRIHPIKGLNSLVGAWAVLEADFPEWNLEIAGPDERGHAAELLQLAASLGLKRVTIKGPVYGEEKTRSLSSAALFVLPTQNENFALTVAESLACGTPVIATKGAPWKGLIDNGCGWWIEDGAEALTAALRPAMLLSHEERSPMGARGRAWMQHEFTWERVGQRMREVYSWLGSGGMRPQGVRMCT